ncbi:MAG: DUF455 family protein [Deltaproteobacteria bacterium]|nr:DUF455 family protein [Deltaproteobacteria bacterium]
MERLCLSHVFGFNTFRSLLVLATTCYLSVMEFSSYAQQILESEELEAKLSPPATPLTDEHACEAPPPPEKPARTKRHAITPRVKVPSPEGMPDPAQRVRILHAFANHELQAVEIFAWALLAYTDAPTAFRRGLIGILREEQRHFRLYEARLQAHGCDFGDFPLSGYFWGKAQTLSTPLRFVCAMSLTFESANLDHALDYARRAKDVGDKETAAVLLQIHDDEIGHVAFGWRWLREFKQADQNAWQAFSENLTFPLRPSKAKGPVFSEESREKAGIDQAFIHRLRDARD